MSKITDIWFRCGLDLKALGSQFGLSDIESDSENYWGWVTGYLDGYHLDITRPHQVSPTKTDTRLFLLGEKQEFSQTLIIYIVEKLKGIGVERIYLGKWVSRGGQDFVKKVVKSIQ